MTSLAISHTTDNLAGTQALGAALSFWLAPGDVLLLHGDLGAGKTTLAKSIAAELGITAPVASPSFALVNEYELGPSSPLHRLYHVDLYRIDETELESIGFAELISSPDAVTLIEWPERAGGNLPERYLVVEIDAISAEARRFRFSAHPNDEPWRVRLDSLRSRLNSIANQARQTRTD